MTSASPLSPTFYGHIASTQDALLLFEACLSGALNHVARRPHDRERVSLIKSGNVFIYEEHSSGIKRWTDGVPWSPSRILGNFLVYRELERPFPPGEKKRAMKRSKRSPGINKPDPFGASSGGVNNGYIPAAAAAAAAAASAAVSNFDAQSPSSLSKETERSLIGSLVDSYGFKEEGLVKKTVSVTVGGVSHHLVSYYTVADVMNNKFTTPSKDPRFQHITPRPDLITKQNFRTPIDEVDSMDRIDDRSVYASYPYARSGYEMTNQTMAHRPMSLPTPPMTYASHPTIYTSYGQYEGLAPAHAQTGYGGPFTAPSPGLTPAPKPEHYEVGAYRPQRYNSVIGIGSEARAHVPPVTTTFARRPSSYEHAGSADSGLSGISATSTDSKLTNDSGYASQGFYSGMRDSATTPHSYTGHRSLPTPTHQTTFDRIPPQSYTPVESPSIKQEMWSMGNPSSGHAHYMAPQWASTGTS